VTSVFDIILKTNNKTSKNGRRNKGIDKKKQRERRANSKIIEYLSGIIQIDKKRIIILYMITFGCMELRVQESHISQIK
jgi:hypothetical protein